MSPGSPDLEEFETLVHRGRDRGPAALLDLLNEANPVYTGRSSRQVARMRGFVFATLGTLGVPPAALPYILDELQNGRYADSVGGAARSLAGIADPAPEVSGFLVQALSNVRYHDDALDLSSARPPGFAHEYTTAVGEILESLRGLGAVPADVLQRLRDLASDTSPFSASTRSKLGQTITELAASESPRTSCCGGRQAKGEPRRVDAKTRSIADLELLDQDGMRTRFGEHFGGRLSVVAFFYTRCDNPNKCSLTVTRLARLQRRVAQHPQLSRVQLSAITYDSTYDLPPLLKTYGESRGFVFSARDRFFRADNDRFDELRDAFQLGVNFTASSVNHHRIELFVVEPNGSIAVEFVRLQWDEDQLIDELKQRASAAE